MNTLSVEKELIEDFYYRTNDYDISLTMAYN